jgi:hypothetical protein
VDVGEVVPVEHEPREYSARRKPLDKSTFS